MILRRLVLLVALVTFFCSPVFAHNTRFLPGDAYFYARVDLESARALADSETPILQYGSHRNGGAGCGYIGYHELEFTGMSADTKTAIVDAYRQFRDEIESDADLLIQMSVFIYSAKYDWRKFGLGLQYNENWVDESVAFGAPRDHVRLESFVEEPTSIIRNWRDSTLVDPLPTENPSLEKVRKQAWATASVKIDAADCKILIIPNRDFDSYVSPVDGLQLIEIEDGILTCFRRANGKWESKKTRLAN